MPISLIGVRVSILLEGAVPGAVDGGAAVRRVLWRISRRSLGFVGLWLLLQHGMPGVTGALMPVQVKVAGSKLKERLEATFRWRSPPKDGAPAGTTTVIARCSRASSATGSTALAAEVTVTSAADGSPQCTTHRFAVDWSREEPSGGSSAR